MVWWWRDGSMAERRSDDMLPGASCRCGRHRKLPQPYICTHSHRFGLVGHHGGSTEAYVPSPRSGICQSSSGRVQSSTAPSSGGWSATGGGLPGLPSSCGAPSRASSHFTRLVSLPQPNAPVRRGVDARRTPRPSIALWNSREPKCRFPSSPTPPVQTSWLGGDVIGSVVFLGTHRRPDVPGSDRGRGLGVLNGGRDETTARLRRTAPCCDPLRNALCRKRRPSIEGFGRSRSSGLQAGGV